MKQDFKNEEIKSSFKYPREFKVKSVEDQCEALKKSFPLLKGDISASVKLSKDTDGLFVIPRWQAIGKTYGAALEKVLEKIEASRRFYNYRNGELGPKFLREGDAKKTAMNEIADAQEGDLLVVAAQFGIKHRGRSVRRVRALTEGTNEFGLGAFEVAIMLLTHPERLGDFNDLWLDCPGDEYDYSGTGSFGSAPYWYFYDGKLEFDARAVTFYCGCYGSASACLPE